MPPCGYLLPGRTESPQLLTGLCETTTIGKLGSRTGAKDRSSPGGESWGGSRSMGSQGRSAEAPHAT